MALSIAAHAVTGGPAKREQPAKDVRCGNSFRTLQVHVLPQRLHVRKRVLAISLRQELESAGRINTRATVTSTD